MSEDDMNIIQLKTGSDYKDKNKGYESTYKFYGEGGNLYLTCDIYGECNKGPTVYTHATGENYSFAMTAKSKLLNATYFLEDHTGFRFATITRKGFGFRWKILDENNEEIARIIDPASRKEAFFRELFSAHPDSYAVVSNYDLIATIIKRGVSG